jgi:hypothetical protein
VHMVFCLVFQGDREIMWQEWGKTWGRRGPFHFGQVELEVPGTEVMSNTSLTSPRSS